MLQSGRGRFLQLVGWFRRKCKFSFFLFFHLFIYNIAWAIARSSDHALLRCLAVVITWKGSLTKKILFFLSCTFHNF